MQPATIIKTSTAGAFSIWKWFWKYKFVLLILFSLIPQLILAVNYAKETDNPSYPFIRAGLSVLNSDAVLYEDIKILETDPSQIIGMEKPDVGIYQHCKYYFKTFLVIWTIFGLLSIIFMPFFILKFYYDKKDNSRKINAFVKALFVSVLLIFIANLITIVVQQASGNILYTFDSSLDFFGQAWQVICWLFPLHGVVELVKYLIFLL